MEELVLFTRATLSVVLVVAVDGVLLEAEDDVEGA